jgi:hypothetical protein
MKKLNGRAKEKIDRVADIAKHAADAMVEKSREAAHIAGQNLVKQGKRLQNA